MKIKTAGSKKKAATARVADNEGEEVIATSAKKPASAKAKGEDMVQIAMLRTLDKPIIVGKWRSEDELGVVKMKKNKSYYVPRHVGLHLKDVKACVLVGENDDDDDDE